MPLANDGGKAKSDYGCIGFIGERDAMARYKHIDLSPRFMALDLQRQLLPGTFEHALHHLIESELDLSHFDTRFRNDREGASAYPPSMLLKVVLFGYSRGLVSSRAIARACVEQMTFIALSGDSQPHFTTLAHFVSDLGDDIARVFGAVLAICDAQGLIGREMFAIDGVKLSSNASKARSGTRADFERHAEKLEAAAKVMLARHRQSDELPAEPDLNAKEVVRVKRIERDAVQIRSWLAAHPHDRRGTRGSVLKSNRTDNESAKMATDKGVLQGFTGVAAVDGKHQIIVEAQAHGTGAEQALLIPVVKAVRLLLGKDSVLTADAGYHSEQNLKDLAALEVNALIADNQMRKRDERLATQARHQTTSDPLHDKSAKKTKPPKYTPADFIYDAAAQTCVCPAGKSLHRHGQACQYENRIAARFQGAERDCLPCTHRERCLRTPEKTATRQVAFFGPLLADRVRSHTENMRERIDSAAGRALYGQRLGIVEPVFGNIRHNKRLNRFTLRGRPKVDGQWKLFCLVHNIEKLANNGYAAKAKY